MIIERKHFAVALMDQQHNMFLNNKEEKNDYDFVHKVSEHQSRIMELSDNQHIYMDYQTFVALGRTTFTNRFCRIFCDTQSQVAEVGMSVFWRVHLKSDLHTLISRTNHYQPKVVIFFFGQNRFLNEIFQHCSKLLLTVVNCNTEIPDEYEADKFPIEQAKYYFSKRKDIMPEMMSTIKEYKLLKYGDKKIETNVEISDNGMKIIKVKEPIKNNDYKFDKLFDVPDYMFYEFSK